MDIITMYYMHNLCSTSMAFRPILFSLYEHNITIHFFKVNNNVLSAGRNILQKNKTYLKSKQPINRKIKSGFVSWYFTKTMQNMRL